MPKPTEQITYFKGIRKQLLKIINSANVLAWIIKTKKHLDYRKDDIYKIREGIMISNIIAHIRYTSLAIALTSYVFCCISCMTAL